MCIRDSIRNAQHGRIQKALVIADDEHGAVFDEFFPVDDFPGEEGFGNAFEMCIRDRYVLVLE